MNKLTIPAILVATVMVAGIFAFMPVEQASTVHKSAAGQGLQSVTVATAADVDGESDIAVLTCDAPFQVLSITVDGDGDFTTTTTDELDLAFDIDGTGINWDEVVLVSAFTTGASGTNFDVVLSNFDANAGNTIHGLTDGTVTVVFDEKSDEGDESFRTNFLVYTSGTCSGS